MNQSTSSTFAFDPSAGPFDPVDRRILELLVQDGRMTLAELGRRVTLSPPSVKERVRRLEDAGIIEGYHAQVAPAQLGRPIGALIRVATDGSRSRQRRLLEHVQSLDCVRECFGLTGEDCYMLRVAVATTDELDALTNALAIFGRTTTSVVLSVPIDRAPLPRRS